MLASNTQVLGFIALYLHLAEISRQTCLAQPRPSLFAVGHLPWQHLWQNVMIGGMLMWSALNLHHAVLAIRGSTSGTGSAGKTADSNVSSAITAIDRDAHRLYTGARQLVSDIVGLCWTDRRDPRCRGMKIWEVTGESLAYMQQLSELLRSASSLVQQPSGEEHECQPAERSAKGLLSSALADAETVLQACQGMSGMCLAQQRRERNRRFSDAFNINTQSLADRMPSLTSLQPALKHNDGLDWSLDRDGLWNQELQPIKPMTPMTESSLSFPTPFSLLRTFPPAPADPAQWSASFFTNCCLVRPHQPVRRGLLRSYGDGVVRKGGRKKVITPEPPAAGASAAEVAAYVCQAEAQLGPLLHAVAPVAAAITQRPWPWVGGGLRSSKHDVVMPPSCQTYSMCYSSGPYIQSACYVYNKLSSNSSSGR
jgi:hypothetical protein